LSIGEIGSTEGRVVDIVPGSVIDGAGAAIRVTTGATVETTGAVIGVTADVTAVTVDPTELTTGEATPETVVPVEVTPGSMKRVCSSCLPRRNGGGRSRGVGVQGARRFVESPARPELLQRTVVDFHFVGALQYIAERVAAGVQPVKYLVIQISDPTKPQTVSE